MYSVLSTISFIIRFYICYMAMSNISILKNPFYDNILFEVIPIYTILMIIARKIVGIFYNKGEAPLLGVLLYFIIYMVIFGIFYVILFILTKAGVLPI